MDLTKFQDEVTLAELNFNNMVVEVKALMKPYQYLLDTGIEEDEERYFETEGEFEEKLGSDELYKQLTQAETNLLKAGFDGAYRLATPDQKKELDTVWEVVAGNKLNFKFRDQALKKFM